MRAGYVIGGSPEELKRGLAALKRAGCERIFVESGGGKRDSKKTLQGLVQQLTAGDALVVWSMASVADSMPELVKLILDLEDRRVRFQALAEKFDSGGRKKLVLKTLLQQLHEFEHKLLERRTSAVRRAAKQRVGRPKALSQESVIEARKLLRQGVPVAEVAQKFRVSRATLYRYLE